MDDDLIQTKQPHFLSKKRWYKFITFIQGKTTDKYIFKWKGPYQKTSTSRYRNWPIFLRVDSKSHNRKHAPPPGFQDLT